MSQEVTAILADRCAAERAHHPGRHDISAGAVTEKFVHIREAREEDFDEILAINAEGIPHVARLERSDLFRLVSLASVALIATDSIRPLAYLLGFSDLDANEDEEFQCFRSMIERPFMYVDQVAVRAEARGSMVASRLYAHVQRRAERLGIRTLGAGVNLQPSNPVSIAFHRHIGFEPVGELRTSDGNLVALLRKQVSRSKSPQ